MNAESGDSFFSRWSKRKQDERAGKPLAEPEAPAKVAGLPDSAGQTPNPSRAQPLAGQPAAQPEASGAPAAPLKLPTLEEAQALTPESDFKPFMAQGVTPDVKNAAMKKLFADPHFNVMDRLDTYIDDYSLPDPLPESMLRKMASAKFLKLFDEEDDDKAQVAAAEPAAPSSPSSPSSPPLPDATRDAPNTPASEVVAQSPLPPEPLIEHDHTDLQLQPDHALGRQGAGRGAA